jgi:hypothetical protein
LWTCVALIFVAGIVLLVKLATKEWR